MDESERKFTVDLLEATLQEEGYKVANRWDYFEREENCSILRVFPRRAEDEKPTLHKSFIVKVQFQQEGSQEDGRT